MSALSFRIVVSDETTVGRHWQDGRPRTIESEMSINDVSSASEKVKKNWSLSSIHAPVTLKFHFSLYDGH